MIKISNSKKHPKYVECVNYISNKWVIRFDINKIDDNTYQYCEYIFDHKPIIDEVKNVIIQYYNEKADKEIICGFIWNDMSIWLSIENQINYKAIYDLMNINELAVFPLHLKFRKDGDDIMYSFMTKDDYLDFYEKQIIYVKNVLQKYWNIKDNINYSDYI